MNETPPPLSGYNPGATPQPTPPRRGWMGRNWKWLLPVGCLGTLAIFGAFAAAAVVFVFGVIKSTPLYTEAIERAKTNEQVVEALGSPIEEGFWVSGSSSAEGGSGAVNIAIPISGPKGKGKIYVEGEQRAGEWIFNSLVAEIESTGQRIDLAPEARPRPQEEESEAPPGSET